ncbi:MAG: hypothetical protein JRI80_07220 [Deltaproteobacteria bacterium]|nr:hypothetical protein [Deltaproteobacteria bacterium]
MGEGPTGRKSDLEIQADEALSELKDWIILLDMAGEYLCAKTFLQKMASGIEGTCDVLKNWSQELKERFVGKPMHEIDVAEPFQELELFSHSLMEAEGKLEGHCRQGKVARQLEEKVQFVKERLGSLKDRVEGEAVPYTARDSLTRVFEKLKIVVHGFVTTYKVATRVIFILLLVCVISFFTLFVTMEKEGDVLKEIHQIQNIIQSKEGKLAGIKSRIEEIRSKTLEMESHFVTREDKISILELNLRSHKLADLKEKLQAEVDLQKKILGENEQKLERMKQKSFLARLLRM